LLALEPQHLDADAELRRFFGAKVVGATTSSSSSPRSGARRAAGLAQRSQLTRPKPGWWPAQAREGLSLRALSDEEVEKKMDKMRWEALPGERWWTVEYGKKYLSVTRAFMQTVASGGAAIPRLSRAEKLII
jgi:hypothetical protein